LDTQEISEDEVNEEDVLSEENYYSQTLEEEDRAEEEEERRIIEEKRKLTEEEERRRLEEDQLNISVNTVVEQSNKIYHLFLPKTLLAKAVVQHIGREQMKKIVSYLLIL